MLHVGNIFNSEVISCIHSYKKDYFIAKWIKICAFFFYILDSKEKAKSMQMKHYHSSFSFSAFFSVENKWDVFIALPFEKFIPFVFQNIMMYCRFMLPFILFSACRSCVELGWQMARVGKCPKLLEKWNFCLAQKK